MTKQFEPRSKKVRGMAEQSLHLIGEMSAAAETVNGPAKVSAGEHDNPIAKVTQLGVQESDFLSDLAAEIRTAAAAARSAATTAIESAIEAGEKLAQAKSRVNHGEWLHWLSDNTELSPRTAQVYMRLARSRLKIGPNAQRVAHLSVREAIESVAREEARVARLPAPVVNRVLNETPDAGGLKVAFRREVNHQAFLKSQQRHKEIAAAARLNNSNSPPSMPFVPPPSFEESLSEKEKDFIAHVEAMIEALVSVQPVMPVRRVSDLINEAGIRALGEKWDDA